MSSLSVFNIMNSQPPEYFPKQIFSIQQLELNCFQGYIPVYGHTCVICIHIYIYMLVSEGKQWLELAVHTFTHLAATIELCLV